MATSGRTSSHHQQGWVDRILRGPEEQRNRSPVDNKRRIELLLSYLPDWIFTIVLVGIIAYFTNHSGFKRQFSLTDTSIQHTFTVKERVSFPLCIGLAGGVPAGIILFIALIWRRSFWDFHNGLLGLILSLGLATTITNVVKVTVGRPRPDLISRCQPLSGAMNKIPFGLANYNEVCSVTSGGIIDDGFKSFPSGHSSFAFAGLGFLSLYLAGKMHLFDRRGFAIKAWVSLIPLFGAALIAISRTMDYRHHALDVFIGSLLGFVMAFFTYSLYYPSLYSPKCHLPYSPRIPSKHKGSTVLPLRQSSNEAFLSEEHGYGSDGYRLETGNGTVPEGTLERPVNELGSVGAHQNVDHGDAAVKDTFNGRLV